MAQMVATQSASLMPWQGNAGMLIDRHDVRAHLDIITTYQGENDQDYETDQEQEVKSQPPTSRTHAQHTLAMQTRCPAKPTPWFNRASAFLLGTHLVQLFMNTILFFSFFSISTTCTTQHHLALLDTPARSLGKVRVVSICCRACVAREF